MRLQSTVRMYMQHIHSLLIEGKGDKERAVAVYRLLFRTHECDSVFRGTTKHPVYSMPE